MVALPNLNFTSGWVADSSDFRLLGKQSSPNWEIPCAGRPWTTMQNFMPLALSSVEKFVTVKAKNKQWPIYPHLAYRHVWIKRIVFISCWWNGWISKVVQYWVPDHWMSYIL